MTDAVQHHVARSRCLSHGSAMKSACIDSVACATRLLKLNKQACFIIPARHLAAKAATSLHVWSPFFFDGIDAMA
jgi:hypothetical protein